jgi:hypothetical protein
MGLAALALLALTALAPAVPAQTPAPLPQAPGTAARTTAFTGYARDIKSGALLYVESHLVQGADTAAESRVVLYRCADGKPSPRPGSASTRVRRRRSRGSPMPSKRSSPARSR